MPATSKFANGALSPVTEPVPSATEFSCSALAFEPIATLPTLLAFACVPVAIAPLSVALELKPVEIEP